jgi:hypothetical protein
MTNWTIYENQSPQGYMSNPDVKIGDTIEVMSNNQLGYKKFKVVAGNNGGKDLETIADWGMEIYEDDSQLGGRRRRRNRRTKRRCSKKNRRSKRRRCTRRRY